MKKYKKLTLKAKARKKKAKKLKAKDIQKKVDNVIIHNYFHEPSSKYCHLFNEEYKYKIRERYDNSCFLCGRWGENGRKLDVHHVFYNKNCGCDGVKCICVPLCRSCHMKTNKNREKWTLYILELLDIEEESKIN